MQAEPLVLDAGVLQPNPWNTNIMTPENEVKLEASIKRLGFFRPVVVREVANSYQILGGEHRAQIAAKLGMKVPCMNLGEIDDQAAKEISIADNARYGADDAISFAEFVKEMGNSDQLKDFLPYTENDFDDLFATIDIDLDALDLDENFEREEENDAADEELPATKAPKTHTVIRFKVSNADAEDVTALIERTKANHGYTDSDDLMNAGDALVHLLLAGNSNASEDESVNTDLSPEDIDLEALT